MNGFLLVIIEGIVSRSQLFRKVLFKIIVEHNTVTVMYNYSNC